jgi:hypothetical protein
MAFGGEKHPTDFPEARISGTAGARNQCNLRNLWAMFSFAVKFTEPQGQKVGG